MSEKNVTLNVTGMNCNGCRTSVERSLKGVDGVSMVHVDLDRAEARVSFDADRVQVADLKARVIEAGFGIAEPA